MFNPKVNYYNGELSIDFNFCNDGGATITYNPVTGDWDLYEIPLYGGEPRFHTSSRIVKDLVSIVEKWT